MENKQEVLERLIAADDEASSISASDYNAKVVLVGGSVLIIRDLIFRQTPDIDTINLSKELINVFRKYDINCDANAFCESIPYNYEDRLEPVDIPTKVIKYYTISLEDLVIMKLFSSRGKDYKDIISPKVLEKLDWKKLEKIVSDGETDNSFNTRAYSEFLSRFEKYKKDYKK